MQPHHPKQHARPNLSVSTAHHVFACLTLALSLSGCWGKGPTNKWEQAAQGLYGADLSSNGYSLIASINHGGSLWRLDDGERIYNWNLSKNTYTDLVDVALSPDGEFGATADRRRIVLWSTKTGRSVGYWNTPSDILSVSVSNQGRFMLIGLNNFTAIYIDVRQGGILTTVSHEGNVQAVSISADGKTGLTGSDDRTAKLWTLNDGTLLQSWDHDNAVNFVALSSKAKWALTSGQHSKANVWNIATGELAMTAGDRRSSTSAADFSIKEDRLLVGSTARKVTLWNLNTQKKLRHWTAPKRSIWKPAGARIYAVAFGSKRGQVLATSSNGLSLEFTYAKND